MPSCRLCHGDADADESSQEGKHSIAVSQSGEYLDVNDEAPMLSERQW